MKIVVTGANGQLGKCLHDVSANYPGHQFIFLGREHFALEQFGMVHAVLQSLQPDVVINAAAYTAVDRAEQEATLAFLINGEAVGNLAKICKDLNIRLIHISTDYVFDGTKTSPYVELDAVNPIGIYGQSKLLGEQLISTHHPQSIIIRTSWVYSKHGNNFVKTMLRLMNEKEQLGVVNDQFGCPTYALDLAAAIINIALQEAHSGIYHFANDGVISWYQFALAIKEMTSSNCTANPITTAQYPTLAKRPVYSALDSSLIHKTFGVQISPWKESLASCLKLLT